MCKLLILFIFILGGFNTFSQNIQSLEVLVPDTTYENIYVKKLDSDSLVSTFVIWIKKEVKAHKHLEHCETILVLEGTGIMTLGDKKSEVKKGDYIFVPENTIHSVKVTSQIPMKVLSVQAPEFKGDDRVFVTE